MTTQPRLSRRSILGGAATMAVSTTMPAAPARAAGRRVRLRLPAPGGPYEVGTTTLHLVDHSRDDPYVAAQPYRELMVNLTYPARDTAAHDVAGWLTPGWAARQDEVLKNVVPGSTHLVDWAGTAAHAYVDAPVHRAAGGRPVLVYLLGHWTSHSLARGVIDDLASRGYVVVAFDPTYETPVEFPHGRMVPFHPASEPPAADPGSPEFLAYIRNVYGSRIEDARFVLDELTALNAGRNPDDGQRPLPRGLPGALDLSRVGAFSGGIGAGLASLQLAYEDRRVHAAFIGDTAVSWATATGPVPTLPVVERGLDRPVLAVNPTPAYANPDPLWEQMWRGLRDWGRELELRDAGQMWLSDFQTLLPQVHRGLDLPPDAFTGYIGTVEPARAMAAQRAYLAAFFDRHLRHLHVPLPRHPVMRVVR